MPLGRLGLLLLLCGVAAGLLQAHSNRSAVWIPVSGPLPLAPGQTAQGSLTADREGFYELQVEVDADLDPVVLQRYVAVRAARSPLGLAWRVEGADGLLAAGTAAGYLYVERGPRSRAGRLKRVLLQLPYGRNAAHRRSLGLRGATTVARGVGRFRAQAGKTYEIQLQATANNSALETANATWSVRPERRRWQTHQVRAEALGYGGWIAAALGLALAGLSRSRRRDPGRA